MDRFNEIFNFGRILALKLAVVFCCIFSFHSFSQEERNEIIEKRIEYIGESLETESLDLTALFDEFSYFYDHPINLNKSSLDELSRLYLLNEIQMNALLTHIATNGKLITIYELQAVPHFDLETIQLILPFVKVSDRFDQLNISFKELMKESKNEFYLRYIRQIEEKEGYSPIDDSLLADNPNKRYLGNAGNYYFRYRFRFLNKISFGITAQKDPGEQFFKGKQKLGFDFYSIHGFFQGGKVLKKIALGDYQIQLGQGLTFWSGYTFGKSSYVMNIKRNAQTIKPYTSQDEHRFLRGGAVQLAYKDWNFMAFGSYKNIDATQQFNDTLDNEFDHISSINTSGLHRTVRENERRKVIGELQVGGNIEFKRRRFSVGLSTVYTRYTQPLEKNLQPYSQYDFQGKELLNIGLDYNWVFKNVNFFGEVTRSGSGAVGFVQGVLVSAHPNLSFSALGRYFPKNFHTIYSQGFGESSRNQNEAGLYLGAELKLHRTFKIASYVDLFWHPWMKFQADGPSNGHEILIQPTYKPNKKIELYFRFRQRTKQKNSRDSDGSITGLESVYQRNYRLQFRYKVTESITLKSRIEYVTINRKSNNPEDGWLIYQDLTYKPKSFPLSFSLRYALFDTDSYDSRIYAYENEVLYVYSIPAYYYRGSRMYLSARWRIVRGLDLWVRYGMWFYNNRDTFGSGLETTQGPIRSDIKIQLRYKF